MVKDFEGLKRLLVEKAREFGRGCKKVFVAVSGGIDSALVAAILCEAYGPQNVVGLYRDIRSNPKHLADARTLASKFGFSLVVLDCNPLYDLILRQTKAQFKALGLPWADEGTLEAEKLGFRPAYESLKSRMTTPLAGFIAKAIDSGKGRIFGTGNGEEDGLVRYFDKCGDGAVDNNLLAGLTKAEVRQLARFMGVPEEIIIKKPSADLQANGDEHNDEAQLSGWARELGLDVQISYGAPDGSSEGNIAWVWKEDLKYGVITGVNAQVKEPELAEVGYSDDQIKVILFVREIERTTRHKVSPIPCVNREILMFRGLVD